MNNLRILVRHTSNARFDSKVMTTSRGDAEVVMSRPVVQEVESMMTDGAGRLMARTRGGDVWPCGHANHNDYDLVALPS